VLPLIGPIDAQRAAVITDGLLSAIGRHQASMVIVDITGVPAMDGGVASFLARMAKAARLLGAEVVIAGIGPTIAQTMVQGEIDLGGAITLANLQTALEVALAQRSLFIQARGS
jgi:rsbT co-antagonist protein RsbR